MFGGTKEFLLSMKDLYEKHGELTKNQINAVKKIKEKNSQETLENYNEWLTRYDEEKKEIANICANYYKNNPPYFAHLAERILSEVDFAPTEKQYKSMCENKFTKKVINETISEPKFKVGQLVQGRKIAPIKVRDCLFSIIEIGAVPVTSSAKGAKIYTLLPLGKTDVVECEERYLKKTRKNL